MIEMTHRVDHRTQELHGLAGRIRHERPSLARRRSRARARADAVTPARPEPDGPRRPDAHPRPLVRGCGRSQCPARRRRTSGPRTLIVDLPDAARASPRERSAARACGRRP